MKSLPERLINSEAPLCACQRGSFTVEAALVLPLMACFFSCILFFFQIIQVQLNVQNALEDTGRKMALLASIEETDSQETEGVGLIEDSAYYLLAKTMIYTSLKEVSAVQEYVSGGAMGISLLASEVDADRILLEADYRMKFPVNLLGRYSFWISQCTCFRKWTGWHPKDVSTPETVWVYVTKQGEVYHQRKSCPYLSLSIQEVKRSQVPWLRNRDGEKYRECESCVDANTNSGTVVITDYGTRFHYTLECNGLKRTIYRKRLAEVEELDSCTKCWK